MFLEHMSLEQMSLEKEILLLKQEHETMKQKLAMQSMSIKVLNVVFYIYLLTLVYLYFNLSKKCSLIEKRLIPY